MESATFILKCDEIEEVLRIAPGQSVVVGRHPDTDLVLDRAAVSRQHLGLVNDGSKLQLNVLQARGGVLVNNKYVGESCELVPGDRLNVCELILVVAIESMDGGTDAQ